jgi:serine/threonine protein kinase
MSSNAQSLVGAVLSKRLRLTRVIGEGGMGYVFAADAQVPLSGGSGKYPVDARHFAVKILRPEFVGELDVLARFLDEGQTCQRLIHPNILRVFETAQAEDGTPYLVMELLDGVPLSAYTANGGRVPLQQAVTILQGILAGLAAAHAQGIVHRDLKPENVFLAREANGQFQIKLLDFGIAKVMDAAGGMGSRTRTGALLGTPAYMSPEQIKDPRNVDPRSDLWSAAIMTWEMLTGRTAFPAPTEYARLAAVMSLNPDPIAKVDPHLAPLSPVLERAMQKDPAQRFPSAMEMARALPNLSGSGAPPPLAAPEGYTNPNPLSRLPAVASVFGPASGISPGASSERHTPAAGVQEVPPPAAAAAAAVLAARPGGGTLQSAPAVNIPTPGPARVLVLDAPAGSTMPSHDLPVLEPPGRGGGRGALGRPIAAWVAIVLVIGALAAGFVLGFAVARAM